MALMKIISGRLPGRETGTRGDSWPLGRVPSVSRCAGGRSRRPSDESKLNRTFKPSLRSSKDSIKQDIQLQTSPSKIAATSPTAMATLTLKSYAKMASTDQKLMMRPNFRMPSMTQLYSPPAEVQAKASSGLHADEEVKVLSSSIICGDPRCFSGDNQFLTSYQKNFSLYSRSDALYTSNCDSFRSGAKPAARTPVQVLAFNFANKINASRGFESGTCNGGGKSPLRRAFESVDINGDRHIDREELKIAVQRMGFHASDQGVIDEFFTFLAGSNAGFIDYVSFSSAMDRVPSNIRACW